MLFYISDSIIAKIEQAGFTIAMSKEMMLSREQAETFYEEHKGSDFFETLVTNMTRFVLVCLVWFVLTDYCTSSFHILVKLPYQ